MSEWYYILEGRPQGPLSEPEMRHVLSCGALPSTTLVWCEGMSAWTNATVLPDLQINKEFEKPAQSAEQSKEKSVPMAPMQAIQAAPIAEHVELPLAESSPATLSAPPANGTTKGGSGVDVLESIETPSVLSVLPRSASNPLAQSKSDSQQLFPLIRALMPLLGGAAILTFAIWLVQQLVAPKAAINRQGLVSATSKNLGSATSVEMRSGRVVAWGNNDYGQCNPPSSLHDAVAIAAGFAHSLALKRDGTVVAWGGDQSGQCSPPSGLRDVVAIAAGIGHSMALKRDGKVVAWGNNQFGQRNPPSGLQDVVAIAAGTLHSMALKRDGTMVAWGNNQFGQCNPPSGLRDVVAIAAGIGHSMALKRDGTVVAWGNNQFGQCSPTADPRGSIAIAAGVGHSMALKRDGTVVCWRDNGYGQSTPPSGLRDAVGIAAGIGHSMALKRDGTVVAWGNNDYGQCNPPSGLQNVVKIVSGGNYALAIVCDANSGEDKSADSKQHGILGSELESPSSRITPRKEPETSPRQTTGLTLLDDMQLLRDRGLSQDQAAEAFLLISRYGFTVQQVLRELSAARRERLMNTDASDAFVLSDPERLSSFLRVLSAARDLFR